MTSHNNNDISIVLCGEAGQGVQTVEYLLTRLLKLAGYNVFATKEYMSRVRGGSNSTEIRVSNRRISAYVDRMDIFMPLDKEALLHLKNRISSETLIIGDSFQLGGKNAIIDIPFSSIAEKIGNKIYANIVSAGVIFGLFRVEQSLIESYLGRIFSRKGGDIVAKDIEAAKKGYDFGSKLLDSGKVKIGFNPASDAAGEILMDGGDAVSMGAIAGGCNFVSSYPMTPSTPVLTFMAQHAKDFGIVVEQAEDEISAINMALGASYAGARAMVTTSGGGFALMVEGVSLAGMLETPVVIHLAQRPAPATGLPTRTEQADLELALYAGHGEFPRMIFAPGNLEQAFYLTQKAFNLADKYQIPVFVLTDQYLIDTYYNIPPLDTSALKVEKYFVKTEKGYKRYQLTESGISPRGIPGFGEGMVCVDSDEHDEEAHITEDKNVRKNMVDKRLGKLTQSEKDAIPPELIGNPEYKDLIVCWGSTREIVMEAVGLLKNAGIAILHFSQVFPFPDKALEYFTRAGKVVIVEGNATSQFSKIIRLSTGFEIKKKILKYNGLPFGVEELSDSLKTKIG